MWDRRPAVGIGHGILRRAGNYQESLGGEISLVQSLSDCSVRWLTLLLKIVAGLIDSKFIAKLLLQSALTLIFIII